MLTYTITVTNDGPDAASGVGLVNDIPAGTTFVSFTAPAGWAASTPAAGGTGTVSATAGALASHAQAAFTLVVRVDPGAADGSTIADSASISTSPSIDNDSDNDTDTATTTVAAPPPRRHPRPTWWSHNQPRREPPPSARTTSPSPSQ